ncbi:MAG: RidA family protein [Methyloligellaceae bacterium]
MKNSIENRLESLGIQLPDAPAPAANYIPYLVEGGILFISGQISKAGDGGLITGKLGADLDIEAGQEAAKVCAINILAQAKAALGDLDRIKNMIKLGGFVNATPEFSDHPQVINGASNFLAEVLGDKGQHTRFAVGVAGLPFNVAVEIDAQIAIA